MSRRSLRPRNATLLKSLKEISDDEDDDEYQNDDDGESSIIHSSPKKSQKRQGTTALPAAKKRKVAVKKSESDDESFHQQESEQEDSDDEIKIENDEHTENAKGKSESGESDVGGGGKKRKKPAKKVGVKKGQSRAAQRLSNMVKQSLRGMDSSDDDDENGEGLGIEQPRLTKAGGYSHTKASRKKIGKANKGKTPWNIGKSRSEATKAKISAGVRARQRAALLIKLEELGMTEEEYHASRPKRKRALERARQARIREQELRNSILKKEETSTLEEATNASKSTMSSLRCPPEKSLSVLLSSSSDLAPYAVELLEQKRAQQKKEKEERKKEQLYQLNERRKIERRERRINQRREKLETVLSLTQSKGNHILQWKPHELDMISMEQMCPSGGPGGLVCCVSCTERYSGFLSQTCRDMETHAIDLVSHEVMELTEFIQHTQSSLQEALDQTQTNHARRFQLGIATKTLSSFPNSSSRPNNHIGETSNLAAAMDMDHDNFVDF